MFVMPVIERSQSFSYSFVRRLRKKEHRRRNMDWSLGFSSSSSLSSALSTDNMQVKQLLLLLISSTNFQFLIFLCFQFFNICSFNFLLTFLIFQNLVFEYLITMKSTISPAYHFTSVDDRIKQRKILKLIKEFLCDNKKLDVIELTFKI